MRFIVRAFSRVCQGSLGERLYKRCLQDPVDWELGWDGTASFGRLMIGWCTGLSKRVVMYTRLHRCFL
jgi:hypothetical protein